MVRVCTAGMIQVDSQPNGHCAPETQFLVKRTWPATAAKLSLTTVSIVITTAQRTLTIRCFPCLVSVYDNFKRLPVQEPAAGAAQGRQ